LSFSGIGDWVSTGNHLHELLKANKKLHTLDLDGSNIGDIVTKLLAEAFPYNNTLILLHMGSCQAMTERALVAIRDNLPRCSLRGVHLYGNQFSVVGAAMLEEITKILQYNMRTKPNRILSFDD